MGYTKRVLGLALIVLLLGSFLAPGGRETRLLEIVDDSVSQEELQGARELLGMLLRQEYSNVPLPSRAVLAIVTTSGGVRTVDIYGFEQVIPLEPGIRIGYSIPELLANLSDVPAIGSAGTDVLVIENVGQDSADFSKRLAKAIGNINTIGRYRTSDLGIVVAKELLPSGLQRDVGSEIATAVRKTGRSDDICDSLAQLNMLADKGVIAFVAHDPEAFFRGSEDWEGFLNAVQEGFDVTDKLLLFFICGASAPGEEVFKTIWDELIYDHGAAGIEYFTGFIDIRAVQALLNRLIQQTANRPILEALLDSLQQVLNDEELPEDVINWVEELIYRLQRKIALYTTGWC